MNNFIRRLRDCTSGAALLETAIVFPLVLTLMFGVLDIARAIQDYHTADKSMRSAARYLARVPADATCGWGWTNARNLAVYGTIDPPANPEPLISNWTVGTLSLERDPACAAAAGDPMTVAITAIVPIPTPLISAIGMSSTIDVNVRHEERHIGG
jgi:hypothetical protein